MELLHYALIITVILIIVVCQIKFYRKTRKDLSTFSAIFPDDSASEFTFNADSLRIDTDETKELNNDIDTIEKRLENEKKELAELLELGRYKEEFSSDYEHNLDEITARQAEIDDLIRDRTNEIHRLSEEQNAKTKRSNAQHKPSISLEIISSINNYLSNNKNNSNDYHLIKDIVDRNCDAKEQEIHTQIPMPLYFGLMGTMAGILIGVGFLVLGGGLATDVLDMNSINSLLGGVALAMISSISGILLTTILSIQSKDITVSVEKKKHNFLSWIQRTLLPELTTDIISSINKMASNLMGFNADFKANTEGFQKTVRLINNSNKNLSEVLSAIKELNISDFAHSFGQFGQYLAVINEYIANVKALNEKLDATETRTKAIEDMGVYFKEERSQLAFISKKITKTEDELSNIIKRYNANLDATFQGLSAHATKQTEIYKKVVEEQIMMLSGRSSELEKIIGELNQIASVKSSMQKLEEATKDQNKKLDNLVSEIRTLAQVKTTGGSITYQVPKWLKILSISGGSVVIGSCIFFVIAYLITNYKHIFPW